MRVPAKAGYLVAVFGIVAAMSVWCGCRSVSPNGGMSGISPCACELPEDRQAFAEALALYSQGLIYQVHGEFDDAISYYLKAIERDPDQDELYMRVAMGYLRQDDSARAIASIEELCARRPRDARPQLWLGFISRAAGDVAQAETAYKRALKIDPSHASAYLELTAVYIRQDRDDEAIALLKKGIDRVDQPADLLRMLGELYIREASGSPTREDEQTHRRAAIKNFEHVLQEEPDDVALLLQLGDLYIMEEDIPRAIEYFKRVEALESENIVVKKKLALSYAATGNQELAIAVLEDLSKAQPTQSYAYYYLGELYEKMEDLERARLNFSLATKAATTDASAFLRLALLDMENQSEIALETLQEGLLKHPDDLRLIETMAYAYMNLKEYENARKYFRTADDLMQQEDLQAMTPGFYFYYAIATQYAGDLTGAALLLERAFEADPQFLDAYVQYTFQQDENTHLVEAIAILEEMQQTHTNKQQLYIYIGLLNSFLKQYEEAIAAFRQAETVAAEAEDPVPFDQSFYFWYAAAHERIGEYAQAEENFRKVIEMNPEHAEAYNYLAYMWAEKGENLDEALAFINKAVETAPQNGAFLDTRGWVYYMQGHYEKAFEEIELAAQLLPEDSTVAEHLGDTLFKLNRLEEAIESWKKALKADPESEAIRTKLQDHDIDVDAFLEALQDAAPATEPEPVIKEEELSEPPASHDDLKG